MSLESRRNSLAFTIGWWLLRRKLEKRADAAVTDVLAGAGRSQSPKRRHPLRAVLLAIALAGGACLAWRRLRGGRNDDGGTWKPEPPAPPPAPPAERVPTPEPDPVAA
jgi:ferric-dicitrate binding protein FerR (iron transport regulator)